MRIFSRAGFELFPWLDTRFSIVFLYTLCLAGNELVYTMKKIRSPVINLKIFITYQEQIYLVLKSLLLKIFNVLNNLLLSDFSLNLAVI